MRYATLMTLVGLTWFLLVSTAASALLSLVVRDGLRRRLAGADASLWLGLRLLPSALAVVFVTLAFVPAFARFEPRDAAEEVGPALFASGVLALGLVAGAARRGFLGWHKATRLAGSWRQRAHPLPCPDSAVPVFCVHERAPVVALVGIFRPRLFIARDVIRTLTSEELQAVVAHELAHHTAWDNLKRLLVVASPDLLGRGPASGALERGWSRAAELAADRRATRGTAEQGTILAGALVKVARLIPAAPPLMAPVSTLFGGSPLGERVEQLIGARREPRRSRGWILAAVAMAAVMLAAGCAMSLPVQRAIFQASELLVRFAD